MLNDSEPAVRALLERALRAGQFPGGVAEWGSGAVCIGRSGLGPDSVPITKDTWFDLASLTKPLATTTMVVLAFREGDLEPTTKVGEVLSEVRQTAVSDLEIHDLLTHTSGLPAWLPLYCLCEGNAEILAERLGRIELEARPGTRVEYSCIGFIILGLMLERVGGCGLRDLFVETVAAPLGLRDDLGYLPDPSRQPVAEVGSRPVAEEGLVAGLGLDLGWIPPVAAGRPDDGNARFLGGCAGNAGLFGTAEGARNLALEYRRGGGNLLTAEEASIATRNHTPDLEQIRGYGWQGAASPGCSAGPALGPSACGHTGFSGVSVWLEPTTADCFVLLTNRNHPVYRGVDLHPLRRRFHALAKI